MVMRQSPPSRAAITRNPMKRFDGRSVEGRRLRDLYRSLMTRLGNPPDPATAALVLSAAELTVAAEKVRADLLAGSGDLDAVVRIENLAARALRRLGLGKPMPPPRLPLADRFAAEIAAEGRGEADPAEGNETATASDQRIGGAGSRAGGGV
jgi:hypothetical protein